ncbi:uncharacterized protein BO97DRAFT_419872 [Aspergillus homomorphus CBS 101889]|uniref:Uncharacterized protein n=1 Tax=Aspergillus homomorphus (strain CBS 101889) TaxID=1450537 RepID=A0A395IC61_ASPHC|nr:hypothetical protein BO97DRAFT_419872 [Aspergillus homomorphus CBS 101889]RAL17636.1 hypothetical protein BO97DRAFT_419872 [Aspergillus homomorphus CBS 101889]
MKQKQKFFKLKKNQTTGRGINRAGTRDAAIADELWGSDGCDDEAGGITAQTTAVSPQDAERYPAVLPNPGQVQREAIARQEARDSFLILRIGCKRHRTEKWKIPKKAALLRPLPGPTGRPQGRVTITFPAYQRGEWMVTDADSVDSAHPVEAQAIAERYAPNPEQEARFYDRPLQKVAVDRCVRAAIDDGSFTVLMDLGRGLAVTRKLVASVTQLLQNVGTAGPVIEEEEL